MTEVSNDQIMEAINGLTDQVRIQNGRVFVLEQARINDDKVRISAAIETAAYQKEINDRLAVIEPITQEVSEIVGFTRTTGKIAKWVSAICGAILGLTGLIAIIQGGLT
jgi:hypothetical protein